MSTLTRPATTRRPRPAPRHLVGAGLSGFLVGVPLTLLWTAAYLGLAPLVLMPLGLVGADPTFDEGTDVYLLLLLAPLAVAAALLAVAGWAVRTLQGVRASRGWWTTFVVASLVPVTLWAATGW